VKFIGGGTKLSHHVEGMIKGDDLLFIPEANGPRSRMVRKTKTEKLVGIVVFIGFEPVDSILELEIRSVEVEGDLDVTVLQIEGGVTLLASDFL